ncbi:MAG: antibiotic biosynthesis monooxygenase family protein [Leptolyngbyaceae cyanobacterium]
MATLDLDDQLVNPIILFKVKPGQQAAVIELVKQLFHIAKQQPGFVASDTIDFARTTSAALT